MGATNRNHKCIYIIYIYVHQLHNYIEAAKRQSCTFRSTRRGAVAAAAWVVECEEVISSPCESPPFFKNKIGKQWKTVEKRIERSFKTHETVENISYEAHEARQPSRNRPTANLWSLTATHKPAVRPRPPAPELLCRCGRKHQWKSARSMFQLCEVDILLQHIKIQNLSHSQSSLSSFWVSPRLSPGCMPILPFDCWDLQRCSGSHSEANRYRIRWWDDVCGLQFIVSSEILCSKSIKVYAIMCSYITGPAFSLSVPCSVGWACVEDLYWRWSFQ